MTPSSRRTNELELAERDRHANNARRLRMTERRLIAVADILGFKNTILTTPLDRVVKDYFGYFRRAIQHTLEQQGWPDPPEDFDELRTRARLGMEWFSDTLILHTKDDSDDATRNLLQTVNWLLFETMYFAPIRLRIGIDYDEFTSARMQAK
jgi:class 3 adenylate cyclase